MNSRSEKIFQALRQNQAKEGKCGETNISHCSRENIIRSHNELSNEGPSSPEQSRQRQPRDEPMLPLNDNIMTENHSDQSYYATMAKESNQSCSTSTGICLTDASKENVLKGETSFCTSPEKSEHDEALVGLCVPLTEKSRIIFDFLSLFPFVLNKFYISIHVLHKKIDLSYNSVFFFG